MKKFLNSALVAGALSAFAFTASAKAEVLIDVDIATQTMHVQSASGSYEWPVSTAKAGFTTPRGEFGPIGMERMHYSKKYHNSPMPYSIFFRGGYAIHGTYALSALGAPASHGCVRLAPEHAKMLYEMVQNEGARISIASGSNHFASR